MQTYHSSYMVEKSSTAPCSSSSTSSSTSSMAACAAQPSTLQKISSVLQTRCSAHIAAAAITAVVTLIAFVAISTLIYPSTRAFADTEVPGTTEASTATDTTDITDTTEAQTKKITAFSIDAGRKYFSLEQLKVLVDNLSRLGYSDLHLIFGNDGLRFLLDDMSITTSTKTYDSPSVTRALENGTNTYYNDPNGNHLTEAEMDELVAYAQQKGLGIIPCLNSPGHNDAVVSAMDELGISNAHFADQNNNKSKTTTNIQDAEASEFNHQLIKKYAEYFASKGCSYFNMGADEYANDLKAAGGFATIQASGVYSQFVTFVNKNAEIIKQAGLKPIAFNDGIYYHQTEKFGTFDPDIIVSYWTEGWYGYDVASPSYLVNKGHKILNTSDKWYYVIGHNDSSSTNKWAGYAYALRGAENTPMDKIKNSVPTIGSLQAIWADQPSATYQPEEMIALMEAFAKANAANMDPAADYSKVDAVLAEVPADLSLYTTESAQAVKAAVDAVVRGLRVSEQTRVDGFADAITAALAALTMKPAPTEPAEPDPNTEEKPELDLPDPDSNPDADQTDADQTDTGKVDAGKVDTGKVDPQKTTDTNQTDTRKKATRKKKQQVPKTADTSLSFITYGSAVLGIAATALSLALNVAQRKQQ